MSAAHEIPDVPLAPVSYPPLPHLIEAEQAVLGACMVHNAAIAQIAAVVSEDDFYDPLHRRIFAAALLIDAERRPVFPLTIRNALGNDPAWSADQLGSWEYLVNLAGAAVPPEEARALAQDIATVALRRRAMSAIWDAQEELSAPPKRPVSEILAPIVRTADEAAEQSRGETDPSVSECAFTFLRELEDGTQAKPAFKSGLAKLDDELGGFFGSDLIIIGGRPGMMKAQPLTSKILLRNGTWTSFGEIRLGDEIASVDGARSVVSGIQPRGERAVFRVTLSDGRSTLACADHLWEVMYRDWQSPRVMDTSALAKMLTRKRYIGRLSVRKPSGHFGHSDELPINPYALGVLLGDGSFRSKSVRLTSADPEIIELMKTVIPADAEILQVAGSYAYSIRRKRSDIGVGQFQATTVLVRGLRLLGLMGCHSKDKFVPNCYLNANREARLEILRGLMDTDGWSQTGGAIRFVTTSERLSKDVQYLVRSIGGLCRIANIQTYFPSNGTQKAGLPSFVCKIRHEQGHELFRLPRKSAPCRRTRNGVVSLSVESIVPFGHAETACIAVTHPSRLYITDDFIVTHNSALLTCLARNAASGGKRVELFSIEMSRKDNMARMLCDIDFDTHPDNPLWYKKLTRGHPSQHERGRAAEAAVALGRLHIDIHDSGTMTIAQIAGISRARAARLGKPALVAIDHMQIIRASNPRQNRYEIMTEASAGAKALAKTLDCPVIALCQLNRDVEKRGDNERMPMLADLRESGSIEQDADLIVMLYRPAFYLRQKRPRDPMDPKMSEWRMKYDDVKNDLEISVPKYRHGAVFDCRLFAEPGASAIRDERPRPSEDMRGLG